MMQMRRKMITNEIERAEAKRRNAQNSPDQKALEELISMHKSSLEELAIEEPQCQAEQLEAESRFRAEQAKMQELQGQLEKLDQLLAGQARK